MEARSYSQIILNLLIFYTRLTFILADVSEESEFLIYTSPENFTPGGNLTSVGSDSLMNTSMMLFERYRDHNPGVTTNLEALGSSTAVKALLEGRAQIGPMTRQMTIDEKNSFMEKYGFFPTSVKIGMDAIVIIVHKDNPISRLNFKVLEQIFSKDKKCNNITTLDTWGEVFKALSKREMDTNSSFIETFADKEIDIVGRSELSGTYKYFKEDVLCNGNFKNTVKSYDTFQEIADHVSSSRFAIGYCVLNAAVGDLKILALSDGLSNYVIPTTENISKNIYPLAKYIYLFILKEPYTKLDALVADFIKFTQSDEGQAIVHSNGYINITPALTRLQLIYLGENFSIFKKENDNSTSVQVSGSVNLTLLYILVAIFIWL